MKMQQYEFCVDLYVLPIEGPDVVLGIQWLQGLGRVAHDFSAMTMEFEWEEKDVQLQGETTFPPSPITLHQLQALMQTNEIHSLYEIHLIPQEGSYCPIPSVVSAVEIPTDLPL